MARARTTHPGKGWLADHHEDVQRIAVIGQRTVQESVIAGVVHARVQDPVEDEPMSEVVVLVLVAAPARDLDRDLE